MSTACKAVSNSVVEHLVERRIGDGGLWSKAFQGPMADFGWRPMAGDLEASGYQVRVTRGVRKPRVVYQTEKGVNE